MLTSRVKAGGTTNTYDADGSTLTEGNAVYTYDNRSRMVSMSVPSANQGTSYTFDGLDERIGKTGSGGAEHFAWGATGKDLTGRMSGHPCLVPTTGRQ